jgi:Family of unknown function (DUF6113)
MSSSVRRSGPAEPADEPAGPVAGDRLPAGLAVLSVLVFTAVSVLSAVIEVELVPVRVGSTVVPVSVALAVLGNICVPVLSRRAVPTTLAAVLPAVAWVATVLVLSQARPEGDVLLVGSAPLVYVTYALLGVGIVTAMVTVVRGQSRALGGAPAGR